MKNKTTLRFHFTPVRMVKILKTITGGVWEKEKPRSLLVGLQTGAVTLEISVGNSQKAKK